MNRGSNCEKQQTFHPIEAQTHLISSLRHFYHEMDFLAQAGIVR